MPYRLAPLFCRPWTLNGMTPRLIENHYEVHYGGALRRLNSIGAELEALDPATTPAETINRLKRDETPALNSTLLHELYFASLGGDGRAVPPILAQAMERDFGSVDRWRAQFVALAEQLGGGSGWVFLTWMPRDQRLINQSATDHNQGIAGAIPILALDMYEHAYQLDFASNAKAYVAAFMRNIDWNAVQGRFEDAARVPPPRPLEQTEFADLPAVSVEQVKAMIDSGTAVQIIDTRPRHYTTRTHEIMQGAVWRDPERVADWIGELDREKPVVTYCVYGFHIGCQTAVALRKSGFDARYMAGGHYAWKAAGGKVRLFESETDRRIR